MSHPPLIRESSTLLRNQQKTSSLYAALITALSLYLFCSLLYLIALQQPAPNETHITAFGSSPIAEESTDEPVSNEVESAPLPPTASMAKVIALSLPTTEILVPDLEILEPTLELGEIEQFSDGWGSASATTSRPSSNAKLQSNNKWGSLPAHLSGRCDSAKRQQTLLASGGNSDCEVAVTKALDWLQKTQNSDGSWSNRNQVGHTALALLAFLGHCETPASTKYGETVGKSLVYLIDIGLQHQGNIATDYSDRHWPYEHAIATYALSEAYTLTKSLELSIPNLTEVLQQAATHILNNQHTITGGWDYHYEATGKRGGDSSIVCWHLQALKAFKNTKIPTPHNLDRSAQKALSYLETCQRNEGGIYYQPSSDNLYPTMTGATLLCFQQWGKANRTPAKRCVKYIERNVHFDFNSKDADLYSHYYYTQAIFNQGGELWQKYNATFRDSLLDNQSANGSWPTPGGGQKIKGSFTSSYTANSKSAKHYRTCLATLMLEVYYRYLPTN